MHYTIDKDPRIDVKIARDQEYINSQVVDLLGDHVHSILLCGGFGRGEGTVEVRGNEIHIVNDYDITIVLKERNRLKYARLYWKYHAPLQTLAVEVARDLRMKQVDLSLKHFSYFEKPTALKVENYEVKHGHVLTYGNEDPTRFMPGWDAEDIPLFEGTRLFLNRGAGMLLAALYFFSTGEIPKEKRENFVIECGKAQLAMGDSILLLMGRYHYLYSERLRYLDEIDVSHAPDGDTILEHYREALEQKLKPNFDRFYQRDLVGWWFDISELFNVCCRNFEAKRLGNQFTDWLEYAGLPKPEDRFKIKIFLSNLLTNRANLFSPVEIRRNLLKARGSNLISIVLLLLFSLQKDSFIAPYIEKVSYLLGVPSDQNVRRDWLLLVRTILQALHPGGEVANTIRL